MTTNSFFGLSQLISRYNTMMVLKIFVDNNNTLREKYVTAITNHNNKLLNNNFLDSGFDLFLPETSVEFATSIVNNVDFKIKCKAELFHENGKTHPTGFYLYPRSSLALTPLRLANHVGIVDAGYRGYLRGLFDCVYKEHEYQNYLAKPFDRLVQVCAPGSVPIFVELVNSEEDLGPFTERGTGGVGSTNL